MKAEKNKEEEVKENEQEPTGSAKIKEEIDALGEKLAAEDAELMGEGSAEEKPADKTDADKAAADKAAADKVAADKAAAEKPADKADADRVAADKVAADKAAADKADEEAPPKELRSKAEKELWYKHRKEIKQERERATVAEEEKEKLKSRITVLEEEFSKARPVPVNKLTPTPGQPAPLNVDETAKVFEIRHKAQRHLAGIPQEGIESDEQARELLKVANNIAEGIADEAHCLEVIKKARAGAYGELSAEIAVEALAEFPLIQARGRLTAGEQAKEQATVQARTAALDSEIQKAYEKHPKFKPPVAEGQAPSEECKYAQNWMAENFGTPEKPGPLAGLCHNDPSKVGWVFQRIANDYLASRAGKTEAELLMLRDQQEAEGLPLGGGNDAPVIAGAGATETSAQMKERIKAQFGVA